jgi:hypothetical protein
MAAHAHGGKSRRQGRHAVDGAGKIDKFIVCIMLGALAQLGERRICNAEVTGSIPVGSISLNGVRFTTCEADAVWR